LLKSLSGYIIGMIMSDTVNEIKQRLDIVDLIGEYVKLNPAGANFKALCPFHNEKTPSFIVSPEKQVWHCFGCAKGGDHFTFVQQMEGVEFPEALRMLATRTGVRLEYRDPEEHNYKTRLLDLCRHVAERWHSLLLNDPAAQAARDYLKQRQLSRETIEEFCLGYAPDSWDDAIKFLQGKSFTLKEIFDAGISITRLDQSGQAGDKGKPYDRFRHRLIFPIRDVHGNIVGFTARKLREEDTGGKYVNSPQTSIYNKSQVLYNLSLAKAEIKRLGYAILVEGNMDVLAVYQAGTKNVVAVSGTALTGEQIKLMGRYAQNVMVAFDADVAGVTANLRGIDLLWQAGFNVKVIKLFGAKDPDELIRKNPEDWKKAIREAKNFMDYVFSVTLEPLDLKRVDHKKLAAKKLLPLLAKLGDAVERAHYLKKLAEILSVPEETLAKAILKFEEKKPSLKKTETPPITIEPGRAVAEHLLALLIKFPKELELVMQRLKPEMIGFSPAKLLYSQLIIYYNKDRHLAEKEVLAALNAESADYFNQLGLLIDETAFNDTPDLLHHEIIQATGRLKELYLKGRLKELSVSLALAEKQKNETEVTSLTEEISRFNSQLGEL